MLRFSHTKLAMIMVHMGHTESPLGIDDYMLIQSFLREIRLKHQALQDKKVPITENINRNNVNAVISTNPLYRAQVGAKYPAYERDENLKPYEFILQKLAPIDLYTALCFAAKDSDVLDNLSHYFSQSLSPTQRFRNLKALLMFFCAYASSSFQGKYYSQSSKEYQKILRFLNSIIRDLPVILLEGPLAVFKDEEYTEVSFPENVPASVAVNQGLLEGLLWVCSGRHLENRMMQIVLGRLGFGFSQLTAFEQKILHFYAGELAKIALNPPWTYRLFDKEHGYYTLTQSQVLTLMSHVEAPALLIEFLRAPTWFEGYWKIKRDFFEEFAINPDEEGRRKLLRQIRNASKVKGNAWNDFRAKQLPLVFAEFLEKQKGHQRFSYVPANSTPHGSFPSLYPTILPPAMTVSWVTSDGTPVSTNDPLHIFAPPTISHAEVAPVSKALPSQTLLPVAVGSQQREQQVALERFSQEFKKYWDLIGGKDLSKLKKFTFTAHEHGNLYDSWIDITFRKLFCLNSSEPLAYVLTACAQGSLFSEQLSERVCAASQMARWLWQVPSSENVEGGICHHLSVAARDARQPLILDKPLIIPLNTRKHPGSHWVVAVALPPDETDKSGGEHQLYMIDSKKLDRPAPLALIDLLTVGDGLRRESIKVMPNSSEIDALQLDEYTCAWWVIFNAWMLVTERNGEFLKKFFIKISPEGEEGVEGYQNVGDRRDLFIGYWIKLLSVISPPINGNSVQPEPSAPTKADASTHASEVLQVDLLAGRKLFANEISQTAVFGEPFGQLLAKLPPFARLSTQIVQNKHLIFVKTFKLHYQIFVAGALNLQQELFVRKPKITREKLSSVLINMLYVIPTARSVLETITHLDLVSAAHLLQGISILARAYEACKSDFMQKMASKNSLLSEFVRCYVEAKETLEPVLPKWMTEPPLKDQELIVARYFAADVAGEDSIEELANALFYTFHACLVLEEQSLILVSQTLAQLSHQLLMKLDKDIPNLPVVEDIIVALLRHFARSEDDFANQAIRLNDARVPLKDFICRSGLVFFDARGKWVFLDSEVTVPQDDFPLPFSSDSTQYFFRFGLGQEAILINKLLQCPSQKPEGCGALKVHWRHAEESAAPLNLVAPQSPWRSPGKRLAVTEETVIELQSQVVTLKDELAQTNQQLAVAVSKLTSLETLVNALLQQREQTKQSSGSPVKQDQEAVETGEAVSQLLVMEEPVVILQAKVKRQRSHSVPTLLREGLRHFFLAPTTSPGVETSNQVVSEVSDSATSQVILS